MLDVYSGLASLDPETLERPTSRIGNASNARSLIQRLKFEDETRMYRYAKIQGLMDGNPPWVHQKLVDIGQGHRANFNLRESEGIVEAAKTPYYDLVFEVPYFADINFDVAMAEPHVIDGWSDIITEEYTETLNLWDGYDHEIQLHQWQMVVNGVGPMFWPHFIGWQSEAIKCRKVLVPMETKANVAQLEMCAVLHSYRADELERFISLGGTHEPDGDGWNIPLCQQAIIDSSMREMRQSFGAENYDLYQRAIRTGDLFHGIHRSDRIFVASLFIKEFGGKVSHYMVTDQNLGHSNDTYDSDSGEIGYLFKRRRKFDSFTQVLCPFFFDSGPDGTWHAVKGLGPKIYDFCDISNRTFCQMLDGAVIGSGITLESQDANAIEETQIALVGGAAVVSPGYKVVQTRIAEALDGAMAMRRELHGTLQANTGSYRQRTEEGRPEPTLGQAQLVQQQQGMLTTGSTNRYYNNLDKWHRETLRRLLDPAQSAKIPGGQEAMEFKARCLARGIPEQVLNFKFIKRVIATRSIGFGSPVVRDTTTRELVAMIPYMDEVSRNHALRARAAALPGVGMHSVDSFFPPIEKQGVPNAHTSMAVLENNALRQPGGKAMVEPSQNQSIHFDVHYQDALQHYMEASGQAIQNGQQPPQAPLPQVAPGPVQAPQPQDLQQQAQLLMHLHQVGPHMAQHLLLLKGDPTRKAEVKDKQKKLDDLGKKTDQLQQQVEEAVGAQGQNGNGAAPMGDEAAMGMGADLVPKMAKVHGDLALKAQKLGMDHDLKVRKQDFSEQMADKKTAFGIQRDTAKTSAAQDNADAAMHLQDQQTTHAMAIERAKAVQAMAVERARARQGMVVERTKARHGMSIAERKAAHDAKMKAKQAAQKPKEKSQE